MAASAASTVLVSNADSTTAAIRLSLSGKTRKIVPSAMPAASAICRVVTDGAVHEQQRQRGGDDLGAAFGGRQGGGPLGGDHGVQYMSESSLTRIRSDLRLGRGGCAA